MDHSQIPARFSLIARLGYAARGLVYGLIGFFALTGAFGGSSTPGARGAMARFSSEPFGEVLLWIVAVGLFAYAAWRILSGIIDADDHGTDAKGWIVRTGQVVSGLIYVSLALWTVNFLTRSADGGPGWSEQILSSDYGRVIAIIVGLCVAGAGLYQLYRGWTASYEKHMHFPDASGWRRKACRFGIMARGVVSLIIAWFFIALPGATADRPGMNDALTYIESQAFGKWLLALTALGLLSFAFYSFLEARYRRFAD